MLALQAATYPGNIFLRSTPTHDQCTPNILLIGDSVDRLSVMNFCESYQNQTVDWADGLFRTRRFDAQLCHTLHGNMAHLHVYGSNATGPYFAGLKTTKRDRYLDTQGRMRKGLEIFTRKLGPPTLIIFQIVAWDLSRLMADRALSDPAKQAQYRDNMLARARELLVLKDNSTTLLLRTAPASNFAQGLMREYNAILRNISRELGVGLVDFDRMLWAPPASGTRAVTVPDLFKDNVHPHRRFLARFGEHLMRLGQIAACHPPAAGAAPAGTDRPLRPFLRDDDFEAAGASSPNGSRAAPARVARANRAPARPARAAQEGAAAVSLSPAAAAAPDTHDDPPAGT